MPNAQRSQNDSINIIIRIGWITAATMLVYSKTKIGQKFLYTIQKEKVMTHVDAWLDTPSSFDNEGECYAKFVLDYKRMPAYKQTMYEPFMKQFTLFCIYEGTKYRVTGASRLGDVWLTSDFTQDCGYEKRIDVADCSEWSKE